jgi:hypothetical protein
MSVHEDSRAVQLSRREFLGVIGKGVAVLGMPSIINVSAALAAQPSRPGRFVIREDRFGRMFPDLPPSRKLVLNCRKR